MVTAMAGSKHGRSGGSGGSGGGEVSPLAAQLQQAWLQTQMPKAQKRSFVSAAINQSQPSRLSNSSAGAELSAPQQKTSALSALKSLSSLFPELANVQEEKKAMISSVFEEHEHPVPLPAAVREKKAQCLGMMFGDNTIKESRAQAYHTKRSLSASVIQQPSSSSDFSEIGPLSSSHSFSGSIHQRTAPGTPGEELTYPSFYSGPLATPPYYDNETAVEVEVQQEKTPLFSYITEMLMDEKLEEKKCMFVEMSAYQAMAKELGDLISYDSPSVSYDDSPPVAYDSFPTTADNSPSMPESENHTNPETHVEEDAGLDTWIDEILSGPLPAELRDSPGSKTELGYGYKHEQSPEEFCTHTDSRLCGSTSWKDGKDTDAECQSSHLHMDSSPMFAAVDSAHGMGRSLHGDFKPVAPSSSSNGEHQPPVDLTNLLIRSHFCMHLLNFGCRVCRFGFTDYDV